MRTKPFSSVKPKYWIIIAFIVVIVLLIVFRTQLQALITGKAAPAAPASAGGPAPLPTGTPPTAISASAAKQKITDAVNSGLNVNIVLMTGSTGPEVKQLQQWLGITPDGIFGPNTADILYQATGQNSISLLQFQQLIQAYGAAANTPPADQSWTDTASKWILNIIT